MGFGFIIRFLEFIAFFSWVLVALGIAAEILFEAFSASKRLQRKARPVTASSDFYY